MTTRSSVCGTCRHSGLQGDFSLYPFSIINCSTVSWLSGTASPSRQLPNLKVDLGTLNLPSVSQALVVSGTPELSTPPCTIVRRIPPENFPTEILCRLDFPHSVCPVSFSQHPPSKKGQTFFFFFSSPAATKHHSRQHGVFLGPGRAEQCLDSQLTRRYRKCQRERSSTCFDCARLINWTRNREIRTPSRKAGRL